VLDTGKIADPTMGGADLRRSSSKSSPFRDHERQRAIIVASTLRRDRTAGC
jgi:hypothetical protein